MMMSGVADGRESCAWGGGGEARSVEEWGVTGAEDMEK